MLISSYAKGWASLLDQSKEDIRMILRMLTGHGLLKKHLMRAAKYNTKIDRVGARQTTYKKLNDITPLPEQPNCSTEIDIVGARQTTYKKLNDITPLPEQPDYSTEIDIVGARQTTYKKLNDITPLPEQPNCSTEIDIVGARQTTYKKLNDITPLPEQPNCSTEIDIVGARQTTHKKLNDITPLPEQPNCSMEIDIVGARQTTQKKLNCTLHLTQIQYPPSTAKIRPNGEDIEAFFNRHIEFYKNINNNYFYTLTRPHSVPVQISSSHSEADPANTLENSFLETLTPKKAEKN
ncbi:hypothetical protein J6590_028406 [Homalodisca vitripennis]|nr:hypothetical protein J6590_028406 [Homalodisca vitripennis]